MSAADAGLTALLAVPSVGAVGFGISLIRQIRRGAESERGAVLSAALGEPRPGTPTRTDAAGPGTVGADATADAHLEVLYRAYAYTVWRAQISYGTGQFMAIVATLLVLAGAVATFFGGGSTEAPETVVRSLFTGVIAAVSALLFRESRNAHTDLREQVAALRDEARTIENHRKAFQALDKAGEQTSTTAAQMALVLLGGPWNLSSGTIPAATTTITLPPVPAPTSAAIAATAR
jgi:hypothetical protein